MKVKKFVCKQCGAPKINPYTGIFVVCDYCNDMIEIDMWSKFELDNEIPEQVEQRNRLNSDYSSTLETFRLENDHEGMLKYCRYVTDEMYKLSPHSLPPNLPKGEKYERFIDVFAGFRMNKFLSEEIKKADQIFMSKFQNIEFYEVEGRQYVNVNEFIQALDSFLLAIKMEMNLIYDVPKSDDVENYLPRELYEKSKLQEGIRNWLPYIEDGHTDTVLKQYNLMQEFIEINPPEMQMVDCENCKEETLLPKNSIKYVCKGCKHENIVRSTVNCGSCGAQNQIPEKWTIKINCHNCSSELRLVQAIE
jgi:hypothetical protein